MLHVEGTKLDDKLNFAAEVLKSCKTTLWFFLVNAECGQTTTSQYFNILYKLLYVFYILITLKGAAMLSSKFK